MTPSLIPSRGDLIWLNFDPQAGREQAGTRPAIVISEYDFNHVTGFAVVCPITNQSKGYAFEVALPSDSAFTGVILTDQFKSLDVRKRKIKIVDRIASNSDCLKNVLLNVRSILA
ncbi:type II toxin-antitoxin system PemK/MazF family toxin [Saccharibacillus sp. JS10]|uniref:type II toxin-antitoxin system PemK/MazF family toxin n=1 Tax=Saccharibacillus sp. JS10 TaxID=2950552 RepID=UPI00210A4786|nr:type II toxin-antitoxin system PemK/MazF family toxin [Saccharibacillus sp. JS10]MCQ4087919.1 type II toxin-antitoxin system PemK/MazF family toxin [Saccharibacillus sp. JS10]